MNQPEKVTLAIVLKHMYNIYKKNKTSTFAQPFKVFLVVEDCWEPGTVEATSSTSSGTSFELPLLAVSGASGSTGSSFVSFFGSFG